MAALREVPRTARQLRSVASCWKPCASQFARCASSAAAPVPDVELESGLATPIVTREGIKVTDPRKRASRRKFELPPTRYRYHPPKYARGPLHPIQAPPSSDPVARDFVPGPFNFPRLKQTYQSTIAADIMTLAYQHRPPGTPDREPRERFREWDDSSPYMANRSKRGPRGSSQLYPLEKDITWRNIPEIKAVHVDMYMPKAKKNADHLRVGRSVLQTITGIRPTVTENKESVSQWGIVKGDRTGVKVSMYGDQAYEFIDKVIQLVLPKIKEWQGVAGSTGDSSGNVQFGLTSQDVMYFPEVEANYSLYPPKMIPGCRISLETTATSDRHAKMLCTTIGIPFFGKRVN